MSTIHWLGAGLSSGPGICALAESGRELVLWNRTLSRAEEVLRHAKRAPNARALAFSPEALQRELRAGDIVVSMLPAPMHPEIAEMCLGKKAHLVTTSYVSDAMRAYHDRAAQAGLSFVNECGLDPGIDHVLAHKLVAEYRASAAYAPDNTLEFRSYCGGFPSVPNEFRYKFSWSPAGVLRALTNQARYRKGGQETVVTRAWDAITPMTIFGERFETYPNRDSIPYEEEYGFHPSWHLETFVRGTIRLQGWSTAWASIFERLPSMSAAEIEALGAELWKKHAYAPGEEDRVVLFVELRARDRGGNEVFARSYGLDERGTGRDTAMGRLVSLPATFAVEAVERGRAPRGLSGAPRERREIEAWLERLGALGVRILQ